MDAACLVSKNLDENSTGVDLNSMTYKKASYPAAAITVDYSKYGSP